MKLAIVMFFAFFAVVIARPDDLDLDLDDQDHDIDIEDGVVTGRYSWISPEGDQHFVSYIADEDGYRVVESNVVPASGGLRADGNQGAFGTFEVDSDEFDD